jgi:hypothetical protein
MRRHIGTPPTARASLVVQPAPLAGSTVRRLLSERSRVDTPSEGQAPKSQNPKLTRRYHGRIESYKDLSEHA